MKLASTKPAAAKPQGRPKSAEKRHQILQAAQRLFVERGYEATSMDDVAKEALVSKQTIYSHFGNKDELFGAAIIACCADNELSAENYDDEVECAVMLLRVARRFIQLITSDDATYIHRLAAASAEQHPHISRTFFYSGPDPTLQTLADYLQRQQARGRLQLIIPPRQAAAQFFCMLKGEAEMRRVFNVTPAIDPKVHDDYLRSCVWVFLRAYGVDPPADLAELPP